MPTHAMFLTWVYEDAIKLHKLDIMIGVKVKATDWLLSGVEIITVDRSWVSSNSLIDSRAQSVIFKVFHNHYSSYI